MYALQQKFVLGFLFPAATWLGLCNMDSQKIKQIYLEASSMSKDSL